MGSFSGAENRRDVRVLEVGCGAGANIWFLAREGFSATGIDGSETAIRIARDRLTSEQLEADLRVLDALSIAETFGDRSFDAILDVACLQHNMLIDVRRLLSEFARTLRPGGRVFSMAVAAGSFGDGTGEPIEPGSFRNVTEGPARNLGVCHFFTLTELRELFQNFEEVKIEFSSRTLDERTNTYGHWVTQARKPQ